MSHGVGQSKARAGAFGAAGTEGRAAWLTGESSPTWVLHLLSAFLCIQPAEAHCRVPVLARGGLQDACGLIQQRQK